MRTKLFCSLFAMTLASTSFAGDEEYMTVTAPNECCSGLPQGLSMLAGWVGASGAGSASLKEAAMNAAMKKAIKEKSKAQEKKEEDKNAYDAVTKDGGGALEALINQLGLIFNNATDPGGRTKFRYKNGKEEMEFEDCVPGGMLNPKGITCTEERIEQFVDPTDGVEKWVYNLSVIEPKYNPKHYYAKPNGYYAEIVDHQYVSVVFETFDDLAFQLRQIAAAR